MRGRRRIKWITQHKIFRWTSITSEINEDRGHRWHKVKTENHLSLLLAAIDSNETKEMRHGLAHRTLYKPALPLCFKPPRPCFFLSLSIQIQTTSRILLFQPKAHFAEAPRGRLIKQRNSALITREEIAPNFSLLLDMEEKCDTTCSASWSVSPGVDWKLTIAH